MQQNLLWSQS